MDRQIPRELLIAAKSMDRAAFRAIVESCQTWIFGMAYRMTFNRTDAEDLSQEIFIRLYKGLPQYDTALPFIPWFRTLATNTCINYLRSQKRRAGLDAEIKAETATAEEPSRSVDDDLESAMKRLPPEYRAAIAMRYYEELPVETIAEELRIPIGTVKTWLFRGRNMLKELLKEKRHDLS